MSNHRTTIERLYRALAEDDSAALDDLLTDSCELVDPMGTRHGRDAIKAYSAEFSQLVTGRAFHINAFWDAGDAAVCEVTFTGTGPDGDSVRLRMCDVYGFRGDRIAFNHVYFDPAELMAVAGQSG
jgi:ketosteroid isomerase-like protein